MRGMLEQIDRIDLKLQSAALVIAGCFMLSMILLTCANIVSREIWKPIAGAYELIGFFGAATASFSLGMTQRSSGHISVDVLIDMFPKRLKEFLNAGSSLAGAVFFGLLAWQLFLDGGDLVKSGEVSETLRIAYYPFVYGVSAGCGLLSLTSILDAVKLIVSPGGPGANNEEGR